MRIYYAVMWNKKNPKNTWSGTGYSLFDALAKKNDVILVDMMPSMFMKILTSFFQLRFQKGKVYREKGTYNPWLIKSQERYIDKKMEGSDAPLISIARNYSKDYKNQYAYMDLNPTCMRFIRKNQVELSDYLPFPKTSDKVLEWQEYFQLQSYKNTKALFTMSEWAREIIIKNSDVDSNKVYAVGAGINMDVSRIDYSKKQGNKFLFIGKDFYRKGGDLIVRAFIELRKKYKNIELYIAGPSSKPSVIPDEGNGITFCGTLPYNEIAELYNKCDFFCMPSRFEAYGIVVIEALVYGLPCVVRNDFAMKEMIQDGINGYCVDGYDIITLAQAMEKCLKNENMKRYVKNKRDYYINEYSWDAVASRILSIIEKNENRGNRENESGNFDISSLL